MISLRSCARYGLVGGSVSQEPGLNILEQLIAQQIKAFAFPAYFQQNQFSFSIAHKQ